MKVRDRAIDYFCLPAEGFFRCNNGVWVPYFCFKGYERVKVKIMEYVFIYEIPLGQMNNTKNPHHFVGKYSCRQLKN